MTNSGKQNTHQPELRFPEFRDSGNWSKEILGKMYNFVTTNSLSRDKLNYERGTVKNIHYGDIHTKFRALFDITKENVPFINESENHQKEGKFCVEGDVIFADASEDLDDVGKSIEIVNIDGEKLVAGLHTIHARQKSEALHVGFAGYLCQCNLFRTQLKNEAQGAKVLGISASRLAVVEVSYPPDKNEQKKIVGCLSSLDDLIEAEEQKLEALLRHKKGLMQELLPAKDETLPKRRFPEFENDSEWQEKTIGDFGDVVTGSTPSTSQRRYYGGSWQFVSPVDISDARFIEGTKTSLSDEGISVVRKIREESILFVCIGSTIGKVAQNKEPCATNQQINAIVPNQEHSSSFIYFLLDRMSKDIATLAGKQAVPIINKSTFSAIRVRCPGLPEQQRIADCLSSVTETITAQSRKLDAMRVHKNGLMQRLFPAVGEVEYGK